MDIVEILLCEGGDVEQWLEPRNISSCFAFVYHFSTLSLFISCITFITHIHMLDIVCVPTLVFKRAFKAPQLLIYTNLEE